MEKLRSLTFIACYLGIAISMLDIITPCDKLKKQIRFIFSMVFIIAIATPLLDGGIDFEVPTIEKIENSEEYIAVTNTYNQSLANSFKQNIENNLKEKLKVNRINPKEILLVVNIDEDNCISISEVNLVLLVQDKSNREKAVNIIKNEIGDLPVNITFSEDDNEQQN